MSVYLVTGGAGFIGSHIVERLLKDGHFVRVLDNFSSGKEANLSFTSLRGGSPAAESGEATDEAISSANRAPGTASFELIRGDIRDFTLLKKTAEGVDYILHQAALRSVPKSVDDPLSYNEVNVTGTLNVLLAAKEARVRRVVFASSSSIYGNTQVFPEQETHLPLPVSPYAASKLAGEHYCYVYSRLYGVECVSLRYFNVFGPRQSLDNKYAVVIPKFIVSMLNNTAPPVHGDGRQSRDFTFVENVVEANILAARTPGISGEVFNVACGEDYTILELIDYLNKIMRKELQPEFMPVRPGDVRRTWADVAKVRNLLKLGTGVNFQQGLEKTVAWLVSIEKNNYSALPTV